MVRPECLPLFLSISLQLQPHLHMLELETEQQLHPTASILQKVGEVPTLPPLRAGHLRGPFCRLPSPGGAHVFVPSPSPSPTPAGGEGSPQLCTPKSPTRPQDYPLPRTSAPIPPASVAVSSFWPSASPRVHCTPFPPDLLASC